MRNGRCILLILDTCAIVIDSLDPARLGRKATEAIAQADEAGSLACCDISLWEIAMLVSKGRLDPGTNAQEFIELVLSARKIEIIPINPVIAAKSVLSGFCPHGDPSDRIIVASAVIHKAKLVTSDRKLATVQGLQIVW